MRRILLAVSGINTLPGALKDWNVKAVTWVNVDPDDNLRAQAFEYFCGPIGRAFGQWQRAQHLADMIEEYASQERILVGHSNGADVAVKALKLAGWPQIESLHLISAATDPDFQKNGLNAALVAGHIGKVCVYIGGQDMALRLASSWIGRLLGYGVLGLHGPRNIDPTIKDKVRKIVWPTFGHSTCWAPENFEDTMKLLTD